MKQNKVSIIVPIYNMEQYLERCIQSLIVQDYKNIEILLVNDGSTDESAAICQKYSEQDDRVYYIEQENQGVSVARNTGIQYASGEWISFVDGDDWVTSNMLSVLLNGAHNYDVIIGDVYAVSDNRLIETSFFTSNVSEIQKKKVLYLIGNALGCNFYGAGKYCNIGTPWAKLYRRDFLLHNNLEFPIGIRRMQDMVFNINVFSKMPKITFCDCPIYYYRITGTSVCRRYDPQYEEVIKQILTAINETVKNSPNFAIRELFDFKRLQMLLENIALYYGHPECPLSYKEKIDGLKSIFTNPDNMSALNTYDKKLFSRKQQIVLWFIRKRMCTVVYQMYHIKNIKRKRLYLNKKIR